MMALSKLAIAAISGIGVLATGIGATAMINGGSSVKLAKSSTQELKDKYTTPTHVQLKPIFAPTQSGRMTTPITVFLESYDKDWIGTICRHNPRIRDAILSVLFQRPLRRKGGSFDVSSLAAHIVTPINQALGRNYIKSAYVVEGASQMSKGSVSRLPFNASGCKGIKDMKNVK
jgi:flagellar basal body-associated protein FliL